MGEFLRKYKKTFMTIVIMLFVIISIIIYRVMTNSIFNYAEIEKKTIETILSQTAEYTEDERDLSKRLSKETSNQSWILSGNMKINEFSQTSMLLRGLLANSRVVIDSKHDPKTMKCQAKLNCSFKGLIY